MISIEADAGLHSVSPEQGGLGCCSRFLLVQVAGPDQELEPTQRAVLGSVAATVGMGSVLVSFAFLFPRQGISLKPWLS